PVQTTGCAKRNLWFEPGTVRRFRMQIPNTQIPVRSG
ncbi:MAG: hypothetical protein ACJA0V_002228, partial [Planctomycetota bacterium]